MAKAQDDSFPQMAQWVEQALVRALIRGTGQDVEKVFKKIDYKGTGAVSITDLKEAASKAGLKLSMEECGGLLAKCVACGVHSSTAHATLDTC